jgi:hypothetical protein
VHILVVAAARGAAEVEGSAVVAEVAGSGVIGEVASAATGAGIVAAISTVLVALIHIIPRLWEQKIQLKAYREHKELALELVKLKNGNVSVAEVAQLLAAGPTVGPGAGGWPSAQESVTGRPSSGDDPEPGPEDTTPAPARLKSVP